MSSNQRSLVRSRFVSTTVTALSAWTVSTVFHPIEVSNAIQHVVVKTLAHVYPAWLSDVWFTPPVSVPINNGITLVPYGRVSPIVAYRDCLNWQFSSVFEYPNRSPITTLGMDDITLNWSHVIQLIEFASTTPSWFKNFIEFLKWFLNLVRPYMSYSTLFSIMAYVVFGLTILKWVWYLVWSPIRWACTLFSTKTKLTSIQVEGLDQLTQTLQQLVHTQSSRKDTKQKSSSTNRRLQMGKIILAPFYLVNSGISSFVGMVLAPFYCLANLFNTRTSHNSMVVRYKLYGVDFSNRSNLLKTLLPQLRLQPFRANKVYYAILEAAQENHWNDFEDFKKQKLKFVGKSSFKSFAAFNTWLLHWNLDQLTIETFKLEAHDIIHQQVQPINHLVHLRKCLCLLDSFPFAALEYKNHMKYLLQLGAFSHPSVKPIMEKIVQASPTYGEFLAVLDAGLPSLFPKLDKQLRYKLKSNNGHFILSGKPAAASSSIKTPQENQSPNIPTFAAAPDLRAAPRSYFSQIFFGEVASTVFWDQGSTYSFISPALAESLQLSYSPTEQRVHLHTFGSGTVKIFATPAIAKFTIPGIETTFEHQFLIHESKVAPVVLGEDFWYNHSVCCQPGKLFTLGKIPIPTITPDVTFVTTVDDQEDDDVKMDASFTNLVTQFQLEAPAPSLPPCRSTDYEITIDPNAVRPRNRPLPKYSLEAKFFLEKETKRLLDLGLIEPSKATNYSVAQVVGKKGIEKSRVVFDYRGVNSITIPIPPVLSDFRSLTHDMVGNSWFTKIDLASAYHQVRISPATQPFTAFKTHQGVFEWKVLPFGLTDSPMVFGSYLTSLLSEFLEFSRAYLDDIIIFSPTLQTHKEHVRAVVNKLQSNSHIINYSKCEFAQQSVEWVGHIIGTNGISITDTTTGQIQNFGVPTTKQELKSFLGHLAYISNFITRFNERAAPLSDLLVKNVRFNWSSRCDAAFHDLKHAVLHAFPLAPFNTAADVILHTDASAFACSAVLLQRDSKDPTQLIPIEYRSYKFQKHQRGWDIHIKEFFAVKFALQKFRFFIEGRNFVLLTDQKSIAEIFSRFKLPNAANTMLDPKVERWLAWMSHFKFNIYFHAGASNILADHLSRNPTYLMAPPVTAGASIAFAMDDAWLQQFASAYADDPYFSSIFSQLTLAHPPHIADYSLNTAGSLLYYQERLCIPLKLLPDVLYYFHNSEHAGHPGIRRCYDEIKSKFYYPNLFAIVSNYVISCVECHKIKPSTQLPLGLLQPVEPARGRWTHVGVDFISGFPTVLHHQQPINAILTMVCYFTGRIHLFPVSTSISSQEFAQLFINHYYPLHGLPDVLTLDRGPQFVSVFTQELCRLLRIKSNLAVAQHQQANGKVENRNKLVEQYLRFFVVENSDWVLLLPFAEFVLNALPHTSLHGLSPFEVDLGYVPKSPLRIMFPPLQSNPNREAVETAELFSRYSAAACAAHAASFGSQKQYFDAKRRDVEFAVGDEVFIDNKFLPNHPDAHNASLNPKLQTSFSGPFTILEKLSPVNYKLEMPPSYRGDNVFHIVLLRLRQTIPAHFISSPVSLVGWKKYADGSELVDVTEIVGHRKVARGYRLAVRHAATTAHPTGEILEYRASELIKTAPDLVLAYAQRHSLPFAP